MKVLHNSCAEITGDLVGLYLSKNCVDYIALVQEKDGSSYGLVTDKEMVRKKIPLLLLRVVVLATIIPARGDPEDARVKGFELGLVDMAPATEDEDDRQKA